MERVVCSFAIWALDEISDVIKPWMVLFLHD